MNDENEPAPSPSAAVVARRASREAKSVREESGSDEDARKNQKKSFSPTASSRAKRGPAGGVENVQE